MLVLSELSECDMAGGAALSGFTSRPASSSAPPSIRSRDLELWASSEVRNSNIEVGHMQLKSPIGPRYYNSFTINRLFTIYRNLASRNIFKNC